MVRTPDPGDERDAGEEEALDAEASRADPGEARQARGTIGVGPPRQLDFKEGLKRLVHATVYLGIFSLMAVVLLDLAILVWGYFPVHEAAMTGRLSGVLFIITVGSVGEVTWTGAGALVLATGLLAWSAALLAVRRSGRVPGLSGPGTLLFALLVALGGVAALGWGAYLAATGHLTQGLVAPNVVPNPSAIVFLYFHSLAHYHGFLVGAIVLSFTVAFVKDWRPLRQGFRRSLPGLELPTLRTDNALVSVFRIYLALLAFHVIYFLLLDLFSVTTASPSFGDLPLATRLHIFADASVYEELVTRVLLLGLPLWLYHLMVGRRRASPWCYVLGGGFRIENAAFVLIVLQAVVFAMAHVAGWDFWKVLPTTISGIAFGYLFLRRGIWAAIMLHFTFDYLGLTAAGLGEWGLEANLLYVVLQLFWFAVGMVLVGHYLHIAVTEGPGRLRRALLGPADGDDGQG